MSSSKWLIDGRQFLAAQDQVRLLIGTLRRARGRATSRHCATSKGSSTGIWSISCMVSRGLDNLTRETHAALTLRAMAMRAVCCFVC